MLIKSIKEALDKIDERREPLGKGSPFVYHDSKAWDEISKSGKKERAYYTEIFNFLTPLQKLVINQHAEDLRKASKKRNGIKYRMQNTQTYQLLSSMYELTKRALIVWLGAPLGLLTEPVEFIYKTVCFGTIYGFLFAASLVFLTGQFFGINKIIKRLSEKQAAGWSPVNWLDINIFYNKKQIVESARIALSGDPDCSLLSQNTKSELEIPSLSKKQPLEFNVDVARTILLLCSVIYERNVQFVRAASEASISKGHEPSEAALFLLKSEELMLQVAYKWNLQFVSMADFGLLNGPFAGAFYDYSNIGRGEHPFIVVVVKGTSPDNFSEWLTDASLKFEACGDYLGDGQAHDGFYRALFPSKSQSTGVLPYMRIVNTLKLIAAEARRVTGKTTNLFVGGHSLGAGIASLLYARFLEKQRDLGDDIVLRDAYLYGTPRACNFKLATRVEFNLNSPINHGRQIWRIANRSQSRIIGDIVTRVPPGIGDDREVRAGLNEGSYYSFAAIGTRVDLTPHAGPPFCNVRDSPVGFSVVLSKKEDETEIAFSRARDHSKFSVPRDLVQLSMWMLTYFIPILHDHFPASYMDSLNKVQCRVPNGEYVKKDGLLGEEKRKNSVSNNRTSNTPASPLGDKF
ncbi:Alpha/Beta hydrolase protein [Phakopsora pachyrhizi]|uniref:Alpha/Beta hydrolase protein n=1 Tax=Phakopsora pachyrhizi TaxID=170000 RepID=A0AAV0B282_PHAPC|nr:Alpha/Beta hydrolase protein [Phakopsora pachyrhizi]KAI8458203.1 Alpha/Beta hydrolase protein [Phakopsora pachyrhizi]CAH7676112.1 Alpha/Beta hydrolase protein [Phakopsora pachyrhizi]